MILHIFWRGDPTIASNSGKNKQKSNFYTQKSIKLHCLKKYSLKNFQEESRALGVLIRENFASLWIGTVQKGATNYQIYTKGVKFEGRIKGFSAEWENFEEGYFLKHFRGGGGQNLPKVLHSSASFEIFARFTKKYISEVISFNSRARIGYNTSCDRVGSGTKLYIAHTGWGQFYSVSGHTFYFK